MTTTRLPTGTTLDRYRIESFVAGGGMGAVYRAIDRRTRAVIALKVMTAMPSGTRAEARFESESRILAQVAHHAGLPRYLGHGCTDGQRWLAMEFIDGETLDALVDRRGPLPWRDALAICAGIAETLAFLHARGVLHRDVKPANLKLDARGRARLLDLGIAIAPNHPRLTSMHVAVGTPAYMAPERLGGEEASPASDLWSLGLVLYFLLTGRVAFDASSIDVLRSATILGRYRALREVAAGTPKEVESLVARSLVPDPAARTGDAAAWAAEARAILATRTPGGGVAVAAPAGARAPIVLAREKESSAERAARIAARLDAQRRARTPVGTRSRTAVLVSGAVVGTVGLAALAVALRSAPRTGVVGASAAPLPSGDGTGAITTTSTGITVRGDDERRRTRTVGTRGDTRSVETDAAESAPAVDPVATAALRIAVTEGSARVFLDGRYSGSASLAPIVVRAPVGRTLMLRLVQPGFDDYVTAITVEPLGGDYQYTMQRSVR